MSTIRARACAALATIAVTSALALPAGAAPTGEHPLAEPAVDHDPWDTALGATWDPALIDRWHALDREDQDEEKPSNPHRAAHLDVIEQRRTTLLADIARQSLVVLARDPDTPLTTTEHSARFVVVDPDDVLPHLPGHLGAEGTGDAIGAVGPDLGAAAMGVPDAPSPADDTATAVVVLGPEALTDDAPLPADAPGPPAPSARGLSPEHLALLDDAARAYARTVVVVIGDGQLRTPWRHDVDAVLQTWSVLPAEAAARAVADALLGATRPTGRLPVALPSAEPDLAQGTGLDSIDDTVSYEEVTSAHESTTAGVPHVLTVRVTNDGDEPVTEVVQAYDGTETGRDGGVDGDDVIDAPLLVGWSPIALDPGESAEVDVPVVRPGTDEGADETPAAPTPDAEASWTVSVGRAADDLLLTTTVPITEPVPAATAPDTAHSEPPPTAEVADIPADGDAASDEGTDRSGGPTPDDQHAPPIPVTEGRPDHERIDLRARVPAPSGALSLTVGPGPVRLAAADGDARFDDGTLHLVGALTGIAVHDTRVTARGWTVSARASDLTSERGSLPAAALGWTPVADAEHGLRLGPPVPGAVDHGPGLAGPALLATARGPARRGTTELSADLHLGIGPDTPPGSYAGTVTVTLFPVD